MVLQYNNNNLLYKYWKWREDDRKRLNLYALFALSAQTGRAAGVWMETEGWLRILIIPVLIVPDPDNRAL